MCPAALPASPSGSSKQAASGGKALSDTTPAALNAHNSACQAAASDFSFRPGISQPMQSEHTTPQTDILSRHFAKEVTSPPPTDKQAPPQPAQDKPSQQEHSPVMQAGDRAAQPYSSAADKAPTQVPQQHEPAEEATNPAKVNSSPTAPSSQAVIEQGTLDAARQLWLHAAHPATSPRCAAHSMVSLHVLPWLMVGHLQVQPGWQRHCTGTALSCCNTD